jgi:hypothetical protein
MDRSTVVQIVAILTVSVGLYLILDGLEMKRKEEAQRQNSCDAVQEQLNVVSKCADTQGCAIEKMDLGDLTKNFERCRYARSDVPEEKEDT